MSQQYWNRTMYSVSYVLTITLFYQTSNSDHYVAQIESKVYNNIDAVLYELKVIVYEESIRIYAMKCFFATHKCSWNFEYKWVNNNKI